MLRTLWNGRAGLQSNQNRMDIISNNMSNVNTTGYKRLDVSFQDLVYEKIASNGIPITAEEKEGLDIGTGSRGDRIVRDMKQGIAIKTDRDEDLAIQGKGFFRLLSADQDGNSQYLYTRDGAFHLSVEGDKKYLVHSSGYRLDVEGLNPEDMKGKITVKSTGEVYSEEKLIGKIKIYDFKSNDGLTAIGQNLFTGEGAIEIEGNIMQGYLENSNVDMAKELTDMMITQRAFELNSKSIKSADEMWQITNNLRGR